MKETGLKNRINADRAAELKKSIAVATKPRFRSADNVGKSEAEYLYFAENKYKNCSTPIAQLKKYIRNISLSDYRCSYRLPKKSASRDRKMGFDSSLSSAVAADRSTSRSLKHGWKPIWFILSRKAISSSWTICQPTRGPGWNS
jgi:hypothetical protein